MSKKLAAKASLIQLPPAGDPVVAKPPVVESRAKTAPGALAAFMASQATTQHEVDVLRDRLKDFDGAAPARLLNPTSIRPSAWANRHPDSFLGYAYQELKDDIEKAGGNVQAIRVRPLSGSPGEAAGDAGKYELVFGHRRHRACLELGLPVLAVVMPASDQELFIAMERENRARLSLSPWEQGRMYATALDMGLYSGLRSLASAIGADVSAVSKALALARLPQAVVDAFPTPLSLQFRWAKPLQDALARDPEGVVARARDLSPRRTTLKPEAVLAALLSGEAMSFDRPLGERRVVRGPEGREARILVDRAGRVSVTFSQAVGGEDTVAKLAVALEKFLA
jgi:ParB family chromosome partitioning protein